MMLPLRRPLKFRLRVRLSFLGILFALASFLDFEKTMRTSLTAPHIPHLSRFLHLLFLYAVGNQNIVISMTIFDPAAFKNRCDTLFSYLWHSYSTDSR
jgi:hypothetical protein